MTLPFPHREEEMRILRGEAEVDEANLRLPDLDDDELEDDSEEEVRTH